MNCAGCHQPMIEIEPGFQYHPNCIPTFTPIPGMKGMSHYDLEIKEDIIDVVRWAQNHSRRSQQVALGCSEVGHDCDLRLAYRIANMPVTGFSNDPWPAVVGTSIHSWMETAINEYMKAHVMEERWVTEMEVLPSPLVMGHTDLYDVPRKLVLDWKFPSADNLKKMREEQPSKQYQIQVQLYGLGHVNAGRPVERVGIVGLGRQGWLKDMYVWTTEFDRSVAQQALDRIYAIGHKLITLDILNNPDGWQQIDRHPTRLCSWCPWFRRDAKGVSEHGCPGAGK